ncbi:MAG: hypothetical protein V4708_03115 [Bacteroidota bacterium]
MTKENERIIQFALGGLDISDLYIFSKLISKLGHLAIIGDCFLSETKELTQ